MQFTFTLMDEVDARAIQVWRYEGDYSVYNIGADDGDPSELLDRRSPYYAARDERGELVGYFCYGTSAEIIGNPEPGIYGEDCSVLVGLAFGKERFAPTAFRLFVMTFSQRAIRAYERAGFQHVGVVMPPGPRGERPFLEMRRAG